MERDRARNTPSLGQYLKHFTCKHSVTIDHRTLLVTPPTDCIVFYSVGNHDNGEGVLHPDHRPKICSSRFQGTCTVQDDNTQSSVKYLPTLCGYVLLPLVVSLYRRQRYTVTVWRWTCTCLNVVGINVVRTSLLA